MKPMFLQSRSQWFVSFLLAAVFVWALWLVGAYAGDMDDVDTVVAAIPDSAFDGRVLIIGETHRKPRSHALTLRLIKRALRRRECVAFALETPASGIETWRRAAKTSDLDPIDIGSIHDSPSLRNLMLATADMARGECLSLHAIDDPKDGSVVVNDRNAYMADNLTKLADSTPFTVVLVGSLHAVRHLDWDFDNDDKPVARDVADTGLPIYVVLQDWKTQDATTEVFRNDSPASVKAINQVLGVASVEHAESLRRYGDALIDWGTRQ